MYRRYAIHRFTEFSETLDAEKVTKIEKEDSNNSGEHAETDQTEDESPIVDNSKLPNYTVQCLVAAEDKAAVVKPKNFNRPMN